MSRIKSYLLGFISLYATITAFGQDQILPPRDCKTAPSGTILGGDFDLTPNTGCLNFVSGTASVVANNPKPPTGNFNNSGSDVLYNFNYRDSDAGSALAFATPNANIKTYNQEGTYWVAMSGKQGINTYVSCKSLEIIKTEITDVVINSCNALDVSVEIKDTPSNRKQSKVRIEWGDASTAVYDIPGYPHTITHTYSSPPAASLKIQGIYVRGPINVCFSQAVIVAVGANVDPKITELEGLTGGSENKITMKGGNPGQDYNIEMKTGSGAWTSTGKKIVAPAASATASASINGLSGTSEYCFRLQQSGSCATQITSNEVCTIKPTHTVLNPKEVKVDWTTAQTDITRYQIVYKESPSGNNQNSGTTSGQTYTFDQMTCNTKYEFRITGIIGPPTDRVEIKSPAFIVDPATGGRLPNSVIGIASVENNAVRINMFSPIAISKYNIYKAEGNSTNFQPLTTITTEAYTDPAVDLDRQQYCYKVDYQDDCGNRSDMSQPFCTIFLTSAESNTLNWTPFSVSGSPTVLKDVEAAEYTIQVIDAIGTVLYTPGNTFDTMADVRDALDRLLNDPALNGRVTFRILAMQDATLILPTGPIDFPFFSSSNNYTFITPAQIYVPSAFTPNMDGPNDIFLATGKYIAEFNMVIYNRWGAPIFESQDMAKGWDGSENGMPAPPGSYGYKIFGIDNAGQKFSKVGSVLLLK